MPFKVKVFGGHWQGVTYRYILLLALSLKDLKGSEDMVTKSNENHRFPAPHCSLMPLLQKTP